MEASDRPGPALVFVYGTLKKGHLRARVMEECEFVGERTLSGLRMFDTGHGYPAVVPGEGVVKGEVYKVDDVKLRDLDGIEGVPTLYTREKMDGVIYYQWAREVPDGAEYIEDGVWRGA